MSNLKNVTTMTTELEDMRQQLSLLKEKLNRQEILNDQLVRQALEGKIRYIDSFSRRKRIWLVTSILFVPGILISAVGMPVWFAIATAAFFIIALIYHEVYMEHISTDDINRRGLAEVSRKALLIKEQGARWLWIGIPGVLIWLATFAYLVLQQTDYEEQGQYILYGMAFGLLIGSALGYIMYRRQQRLIDDLRDSIETT